MSLDLDGETDWHTLSPTDFEYYVADLYDRMGYSTEVTQKSNDKGVDVFAKYNGQMVVIQAKRNSPDNKVGSPTVQKTAGAMVQYDADKAAVVTTSSFTSQAESVARKSDIELIDGTRLRKLEHEYSTADGEPLADELRQFILLATIVIAAVGLYYLWQLVIVG